MIMIESEGITENVKAWRTAVPAKIANALGIERVMFGVDGSPANMASQAPEHVRKDVMILRNLLGLSEEQIETFFWGACERFFGA